jgi:plastocyanin
MKTIIGVIVVLALIAGGWWYYTTHPQIQGMMYPNGQNEQPIDGTTPTGPQDDATPPTDTAGNTTVNINVNAGETPSTAQVMLLDSGFSPKSVTIKKGGTVTWSNESAGQMWVGSASHPTHTAYDGTALSEHCAAGADEVPFDQCKNGMSYSFTFTKVGTWNYHNHSNSSQFGSVVVVE